jgi:hypothetical protein
MMMKPPVVLGKTCRFGFVLLCLILISSCEYEPVGKYFDDVKKPDDTTPVNIDLNLMTDTINYYWSSTLNMNIDPGKLKVLSVKYYLDENEVTGAHIGDKYSVVLNFNKPETHKFRFTIFINSGTGSIADKLNAEGYKFESRVWTLVGKQTYISKNLTAKIVNKQLEFSWPAYDGPDYQNYRFREVATGNSYDLTSTSFTLTSYVGESGDCNLYVVDNSGSEHLWGRCTMNKTLPALKISGVNNNVVLTWNKSIFSGQIAEYRIFSSDITTPYAYLTTVSVNDTSLAIPLVPNTFGPTRSFYIYCVPKNAVYIPDTNPFCSYLEYVKIVLPGPHFLDYYGLNASGFYFNAYSELNQKNIMYKYSQATDKATPVMQSVWATSISPNGNYMLVPRDSMLDLYETEHYTIVKSTNLKPLSRYFAELGSPKVSDNGICVLNANYTLYAFDLLNNKLLGTKSMQPSILRISADGKYVCITRADSILVYQIFSNSISYQAGYKNPHGLIFTQNCNFCSDNPENLWLFDTPNLLVMSCNDLSVIRNMPISPWIFNIDYTTHKVLTASNGSTFKIYDFNTGNLVQTVTGISGDPNYTLLNNNTIFRTDYKFILNTK